MKKVLVVGILFSSWLQAQEQVGQLTLRQAYDLAVKQSETVALTDEYIRQAEAQYGQAKGGALPEVFFGYDSTWQDKPTTSGATPGTFFISPQTNTKLGIRKNLFTGYRELASIKAGSSFIDQRKDEKRRAMQLLLADVANAFYSTLQAQADVEISKKNHQLILDRLKETRQRVLVGRNRSADLAALESQANSLEALTLENERLELSQRQLLSFLVGRSVVERLLPVESPQDNKTLDQYLQRINLRPDVQAQEKAIDVAMASVRVERSKHFPNLDMGANYYLDRTGFRQDVDWDATIMLEIPIWSWGATQKGVNVAKSVVAQQRLIAHRIHRQAEFDIQNAYRDATSARAQKIIYEKASLSAQKEHNLTVRDYRNGLVNTFDVLETMNRLYTAERGLNWAVLRARLAEINLKIAGGFTPEEIVQ